MKVTFEHPTIIFEDKIAEIIIDVIGNFVSTKTGKVKSPRLAKK